jgi:hypothetical protein
MFTGWTNTLLGQALFLDCFEFWNVLKTYVVVNERSKNVNVSLDIVKSEPQTGGCSTKPQTQQTNSIMKAFHTTSNLTFIGLCLAAANGAQAQVPSINSVYIYHAFNDMPGATVSPVNSYPGSVTLSETGVTRAASGGLNRDIWQFSNNGGASAYQFQNNDYFNASFSLTLTGSGTSGVDLEAGWIFSNPSGGFGGDLQSIVTSTGVVAQFGGPSYYPFSPATGGFPGAGGSVPNYALGQTYIMGLNYVIDPNTGLNAFQYSVNGQYAASSPGDTYFDLPAGEGAGSVGGNPLGGYLQIGNDPNNPNNNGTAVFGNVMIVGASPEPGTIALLGLGIVPFVLRRLRK